MDCLRLLSEALAAGLSGAGQWRAAGRSRTAVCRGHGSAIARIQGRGNASLGSPRGYL